MSSMRARRRAPPPPPPRRRPNVAGIPRLAAIKLEGDWGGPPKITRQNVTVFGAGIILFAGAAIAGAAWLGGSLFDARTAFAQQTDAAFTRVGIAAREVQIEGVDGAREAEVRAVVMPEGRTSLLSADPDDIRARVRGLDWVENATVQRHWPDKVVINVTRRAAFARWQENRTVTVIDAAGERLLSERAVDHQGLPLVVGAGASHAAAPLLVALEQMPQTQARLAALVRVGERRWNLQMKSGLTVALPEAGAVSALHQLEELQREHRLLDRPIGTLDLRVPGRLAVRTEPQLLGQEGA